MSEDINEIEVIHPKEVTITVGEDSYVVQKFCLSKTLRMFTLLSDLLKDPEVNNLFGADPERWIAALLQALPHLLKNAEPIVLKMIALTLTSNKRLREIDEDEKGLDVALASLVKELSYNEALDLEKLIEVVTVAIERMGLDAIRKNLPVLRQQIQKNL